MAQKLFAEVTIIVGMFTMRTMTIVCCCESCGNYIA